MNEHIGPVSCQQFDEQPFLGREMTELRQTSEYAAQMIDEEIKILMSRCEQVSMQRLRERSRELSRLAQSLLEHESLDKFAIQKLLG